MSYGLFILLTIIVFINFKRFYSSQEQQPFFIFFIFSVTVLYTPIIYYIFDLGDSYRHFSTSAFNDFQLISIGIFAIMYLADIFANILTFKDRRLYQQIKKSNICIKNQSSTFNTFLYILIGIICLYICIYFNKLTVVKLIKTGTLSSRSDMTGDLPHWFMMYSLIVVFIPILYFMTVKNKSTIIKLIGILFVLAFLMIDGNKGFVFTFFIYIALFKLKNLFSLKTCCLLLAGVFMYLFMMAGSFTVKNDNIQHLSGAFRRAFVTQGATGIPNRLEMKSQGFDFNTDTRIAKEVFEYVYGYDGGSCPTFFVIDIGILYGFTAMFIIAIVAISFLAILSKKIFFLYNKNDTLYWCYTYLAFCCAMSEMTQLESWYRYIFTLTVMFVYTRCIETSNHDQLQINCEII